MISIKNIVYGTLIGTALLAPVPFIYLHKVIQPPPSHVDLGMNGVPVLNQGANGSCVTFAVTAALDAELGRGDYISQLCTLQLGNYLEKNAYTYSGWNGSWGRLILSRIETFGIISKQDQQKYGCGGIKEYNNYHATVDYSEMTVEQFGKHSVQIIKEDPNKKDDLYWYALNNSVDFTINVKRGDKLLQKVKHALQNRHRVLFSTLLINTTEGEAGAVGEYRVKDDTWILPSTAVYGMKDVAGHEMLIIGYDDDAIVINKQGIKQKGVIKLRNSWGPKAGDHGDFYMTYDYFRTFAVDAIVISKLKHDVM